MEYKTLSNGVIMPVFGLGTYRIEGSNALSLIEQAIAMGYRHIDTATIYGNEHHVGTAIRNSNLPRGDFFVTTKVWNDDQGYDLTLKALDASLQRLAMDYVDLYLIHWPQAQSLETWRALEQIYASGRARAIGVSNFEISHLKLLLQTAKVVPMVNQFERHPYLLKQELHNTCRELGIVCQAWSPIARGKVLHEDVLKQLADQYQKTIAQVVLRWQIQTDFVVFPKSGNIQRLRENQDIFDFSLSEADIARINRIGAV